MRLREKGERERERERERMPPKTRKMRRTISISEELLRARPPLLSGLRSWQPLRSGLLCLHHDPQSPAFYGFKFRVRVRGVRVRGVRVGVWGSVRRRQEVIRQENTR